MSQTALAKQVNVRVENIQNWEHSRTIPAVYHLPKRIDFLGYDPLETSKKND
jgi:ribosome-binding protein aMBF1 (putative translation factor)